MSCCKTETKTESEGPVPRPGILPRDQYWIKSGLGLAHHFSTVLRSVWLVENIFYFQDVNSPISLLRYNRMGLNWQWGGSFSFNANVMECRLKIKYSR